MGKLDQCKLSLHDAELINVAAERTNSLVCLSYRLEKGGLCTAELHGVKAFRCEDLVLQNVASRALQSSRKSFSSEELSYWMTWVTSLSDAASWLSDQRKQDWLSACEDGNLELIVIEPSAGAQIAVVCESIVLR